MDTVHGGPGGPGGPDAPNGRDGRDDPDSNPTTSLAVVQNFFLLTPTLASVQFYVLMFHCFQIGHHWRFWACLFLQMSPLQGHTLWDSAWIEPWSQEPDLYFCSDFQRQIFYHFFVFTGDDTRSTISCLDEDFTN